jgi:hypothetical protein
MNQAITATILIIGALSFIIILGAINPITKLRRVLNTKIKRLILFFFSLLLENNILI